MTEQHIPQTSWKYGQVDDIFSARVDTEVYQNSAKRIKNWLITESGALRRRPSTLNIGSFTPSVTPSDVKMFPFKTVDEVPALIVVEPTFGGGGAITNTRYSAVRLDTGATILIDAAGPVLDPTDSVQVDQSLFMTGNQVVRVFGSDITALTVEAVTLYRELPGTYSCDVSASAATFNLDDITKFIDADVLDITLPTSVFIGNSGVTGTITSFPSKTSIGITSRSADKSVNISQLYVEVPSDVNEQKLVDFFNGRLIMVKQDESFTGGTGGGSKPAVPATYEGATLYISQNGNPFNIMPGNPFETSAIVQGILTKKISTITFVSATPRRLIIGTTEGILASVTEEVVPNTFSLNLINNEGAAQVNPVIDDDSLLFISSKSKSLIGIKYQFGTDTYSRENKSILAPSIAKGLDYLTIRYPNTYDNTKNVVGAEANYLAFLTESADGSEGWTQIVFDNLPNQVVTGVFTLGNELYVAIADTDFYFLKFDWEYEDFVMDIKSNATGAATSWNVADTLLHDKTGYAIVDGVYDGPVDINNSGNFTTKTSGTTVVVGLGFESLLDMRPPVGQDNKGVMLFRKQQNAGILIKTLDTRRLLVDGIDIGEEPSEAGENSPTIIGIRDVPSLGWTPDTVKRIQNVNIHNAKIVGVSRKVFS